MIADILYVLVTSALFFSLVWGQRSANKTIESLSQRVAGLESASGERMAEINRVLADPDKIDAELEKSANLTEMRRAKRRHLPRPDAGPPARVSKLKIFRS